MKTKNFLITIAFLGMVFTNSTEAQQIQISNNDFEKFHQIVSSFMKEHNYTTIIQYNEVLTTGDKESPAKIFAPDRTFETTSNEVIFRLMSLDFDSAIKISRSLPRKRTLTIDQILLLRNVLDSRSLLFAECGGEESEKYPIGSIQVIIFYLELAEMCENSGFPDQAVKCLNSVIVSSYGKKIPREKQLYAEQTLTDVTLSIHSSALFNYKMTIDDAIAQLVSLKTGGAMTYELSDKYIPPFHGTRAEKRKLIRQSKTTIKKYLRTIKETKEVLKLVDVDTRMMSLEADFIKRIYLR